MIRMTDYQTLIGQDVQIAQNKFTASAEVALAPPHPHGIRITGLQLKLAYDGAGGGAALNPPGTLYFFRSDPAIAAATGSTALTVAQLNEIVGKLVVAATDWENLAADLAELAHFGGMWVGEDSEHLRMPGFPSFWVDFLYTGATTINSAAGDQEVLSLRLFYDVGF